MSGEPKIRQDIISKLKNASSLRYSELKDPDIDRDLFNYHLKQLVETGLINRLANRGGYELSQKGRQRVADIIHPTNQGDRLFKLNVLLIVIDRRPDGIYIVNQSRTAHPDFGIKGVPGGTILKTEPLLEASRRKLLEETGLHADFEYLAMTRRIVYQSSGKFFADVLFPICISEVWHGELVTTEYGENYWESIDQAIENEAGRITHLTTVLEAIKNGDLTSVRGSYHEQILHRTDLG